MKIDHIGIATRSIEEGLAVWRDALGLEVDSTEEVTEQGVKVCMLAVGDTHVELLEPLSAETAVGSFSLNADRECIILQLRSRTFTPRLRN